MSRDDSRLSERAASLLRTPLTDDSVARRARVRLALHRPRRRLMLKPAAAMSLFVGGLALASVSVGRAPIVRAWRAWTAPRVESTRALAPPLSPVVAPAPKSEPLPAPSLEPSPPKRTATRSAHAHIERASTEAAALPEVKVDAPIAAPEVTTAPPPVASPLPDEARLVYLALRALRTDADPQRAIALADEYQREFPRAAFVEDAMAVGIEARAALHDPDAAAFSKRYLQRYPRGRYRELAKRTLHLFAH